MINEKMVAENAVRVMAGENMTLESLDVILKSVASMLVCSMNRNELNMCSRSLRPVILIDKVNGALKLAGVGEEVFFDAGRRVFALLRKASQDAINTCIKTNRGSMQSKW